MAATAHSRKFVSKSKLVSPATIALERQKEQHGLWREAIATIDCLRTIPTNELEPLVGLCVFRAFAPGATVLSEHGLGEFLYLVVRGSLRLSLHDKEGHEVILGVVGPGDCFGEGAVFGDLVHRAEVQAETRCYLLQLPVADLQALLASMPHLEAMLRQMHRQRLVESTLARVPLFSPLSSVERSMLVSLLQAQHYQRTSVIVQRGKHGAALYLIESGQVVVEDDTQTIATLDEGDFFGEMSLIFKRPHSANVRAMTPVDVLALPATTFETLLDQRPDLRDRLHTIVAQRRTNHENMRNDQDRSQRLTLAVQHGLLRGSHLLVRDPHLCEPDCRHCETACATRHGNQRLHLNGTLLDGLDMVDTCRQCRVGAECVEACPEHAIEWNDQGALIITDRCTGCGACVTACPYDAVDSVPRVPGQGNGPLRHLWEMLNRARQAKTLIPLEAVSYTHRADKCDLCHGYDDMACVSACPTGALRLVPVEEVFPL